MSWAVVAVAAMSPDGWEPDREQARRLLEEELSAPEYAEARPNPVLQWLADALGAVMEWLSSLGGAAPSLPGWVLPLLLVAVAGVVLWFVRPRTNAAVRARRAAAVLSDRSISPEQYRRTAASAAAAGHHAEALAAWYRALVRQAEVRTVLAVKPGRTATEAALGLGAAFPAEQAALDAAADGFNAVVYGERPSSPAQAAAVRDLDERLRHLQPAPDPSGAGSGPPSQMAAPR
ncbi:DUF4129 domain-containing protein [Citricoccus nitrophenolicus]|uniref:DUF4129 domain-containing protein n=1 Tax=Citricoccus nitrophenolicus TaxID=863575 RepID=A0ABV0ILN7_9MICC